MMFMALLTKELRLRLRNERAIWVLVIYVVLLGGIGIIVLANLTASTNLYSNPIGTAGKLLYILLSIIQFLLIIFITPAFTATAINGEKERQTYELLLSSQLSGFALVGGKLLAGLINVFLLIAAAIPLFSLVFFFGGVSLVQFLATLVIFCVTVFMIGSVSLFLSTVIQRPAISTAAAYALCLLWLGLPIFGVVLFVRQPASINDVMVALANVHPLLALISIEPTFNWSPSGWLQLPPWVVFACVNMVIALFIFWLTAHLARPRFLRSKKVKVVHLVTTNL
jgi:ABC-type transport system involved in multi-copper enzyme maturation permease subunit